MKKIVISSIFVVAAAAYAAWVYVSGQQQPVAIAQTASDSSQPDAQTQSAQIPTQTAPTQTTPTQTQPAPTQTTHTTSSGQYADGTYTGSPEDAFYGTLQVQATVSGGKLTDVAFLQYPSDQPESRQVNGRSNPLLRSEAIAAQSANVDIVSGATQSSQAFIESLGSALAQAKNS